MSFKTVAADVGKVSLGIVDGKYIGDVVTDLDKAEKVLATVITDESGLRTVLTSVVKDAMTLGAQVAACVSEKGLNLTADAALLASIEQFFTTDISGNLIPEIEKVWGSLATDVKTPPVTPTVVTPVVTTAS